MRIAIAGTHRNGKTTLAEAIGRARPDFAIVPELYELLLEQGEDFLDHYAPEGFIRQLEHQVEVLAGYTPGDLVVFDRSPLDFLAYRAATDASAAWAAVGTDVVELAASGLRHLDLIAWLPIRDGERETLEGSLRHEMDARLVELVVSDPLGLLGEREPELLELRGSTADRLATLLRWLDRPTG